MITAVLPTYRRREALLQCLPNHLSMQGIGEVVIVDDGSDDGTADAVHRLELERVRVVQHRVNRGLPAARNTGAAAARGEWVLFLEDDCGFPEDYATVLIETAEREGADIVGAPWLHTIDNEVARRAPYQPVDTVSLLTPPWSHPRRTVATPFLPALVLVRRSVFDAVQYDEGYRGNFYREETDFFIAAMRLGFRAVLTPDTASWQLGSFSGGCKLGSQLRYDLWSVRNTARLLRKHGRWLRERALLPRPAVALVRFTLPLLPFYAKWPARASRDAWRRTRRRQVNP